MDMRQHRRRESGRRSPRAYRQELRARQTDANTTRIVDATLALIAAAPRVSQITLEDIARESGLTVRTILRRFGSRDHALEAGFVRLKEEFGRMRVAPPGGDLEGAVKSLLDQYEQIGPLNMRALEQEHELPLLHQTLDEARRYHREWLADVFAPSLARFAADERERRLTALYAATDIYLWKLLRRDLKQGRRQTEETFRRLVRGVLAAPSPRGDGGNT
jgi:AcrR family transcriptional regulator